MYCETSRGERDVSKMSTCHSSESSAQLHQVLLSYPPCLSCVLYCQLVTCLSHASFKPTCGCCICLNMCCFAGDILLILAFLTGQEELTRRANCMMCTCIICSHCALCSVYHQSAICSILVCKLSVLTTPFDLCSDTASARVTLCSDIS